jgi:hypothetical protein
VETGMTPEENTLQRYYHWSFKMYCHFVDERNSKGTGPDSWMYLSFWFASLSTTIEGWLELKLADPGIDPLLAKTDCVALLKRYRNGVAHFQKSYWDARFGEMISQPDTATWAEALTQAFGNYFSRRAVETNHPALQPR